MNLEEKAEKLQKIKAKINFDNTSKDDIIQDLLAYQAELEIQNAELIENYQKADELKQNHIISLEKSRDYYLKILDNFPAMIWRTDIDGNIDYFNKSMLEFTGLNFEDKINEGLTLTIHPDDAIQYHANFQSAVFTQTACFQQYRLQRFDKEYRWIDDFGKPYYDFNGKFAGFIGSCYDVTHKKLSVEAVINSEKKFRILIDNLPVAIYMIDLFSNKTIYANTYTAQLFGYTLDEILNISLLDVVHPDFKPAIIQRIQDRLNGISVDSRNEIKIIAKSSEEKWLETNNNIISFEGKTVLLGSAIDITKRKNAEALLTENEIKYRTFFESTGDYVLVISLEDLSNPYIMDANEAAFQYHGYSREELIGQPIWILDVPHRFEQNLVHVQKLKKHGDIVVFENEHKRKDGSTFPIETVLKLIKIGDKPPFLIAVERDISERKKIEQILKEKQKFNEMLVNSLPHYTFLINKDKKILALNDSAKTLNANIGDYCWEGIHQMKAIPENEKEYYLANNHPKTCTKCNHCRADEIFSKKQSVNTEVAIDGKLWDTWWIPVDEDIYLHYIIDITEKKTIEMELEQALQDMEATNWELKVVNEDLQDEIQQREKIEGELNLQKEMLQMLNESLEQQVIEEVQKNREKDQLMLLQSRQAAMGEMIGNIAHQWRQPLNSIGLMVYDILDAYNHGEFNKEYMEKRIIELKNVIQHMSQTIDDFRNFFKPEKELHSFNLKDVINKSCSFIYASFQNYSINMEVKGKQDVVVSGHFNEYAQVLLNILNNAKDQLLEKQIKNPKIEIIVEQNNEMAFVKIKDNGGGIPDNVIHKIFEPYFTTKEQGKGSGIGLYMSKIIIEKNMGGKLYAQNTDDGAMFIIEMKYVQ